MVIPKSKEVNVQGIEPVLQFLKSSLNAFHSPKHCTATMGLAPPPINVII